MAGIPPPPQPLPPPPMPGLAGPPRPQGQVLQMPPHMPQMSNMIQQQQNWPSQFQTTYEGYTLRKAEPEPGQRPNWSRVKMQPFTVTASEFAAENRSARAQLPVNSIYDKLRADAQRDAIDRMLEDARRQEPNPFAEWKLAFIKAHRAPIPGTLGRATETTHIRVILKRLPRQLGQQPSSQMSKFGRVIDTSEPQIQVWPQQPQMMSQQLPPPPQALPPPPQNMPPPMQGPPGPNKGGNMGGGGGQNKQNENSDKTSKNEKGGNVPKPKSGKPGSRTTSPAPILKESKSYKEKVMNWNGRDARWRSDSDDDSSIKAVYANTIRHKTSRGNFPRNSSFPRPPLDGPYMSGSNRLRHISRSPPFGHRSSPRADRRGYSPAGKRFVEKRIVYAADDASSDESYVLLDGNSSKWSDRGSDYTDPSSLDSRPSRGSKKFHRGSYDGSHRRRSISRNRHSPRGSLYDDRCESHRLKRHESVREHRKPSPYRGLSPPSSTSSSERDRERDREVHVHIHGTDATLAMSKKYPSPTRLAEPRRLLPDSVRSIAYGDNPTYDQWLNSLSSIPHAPMAPALVSAPLESPLYERQRQQEAAAKLYLESQRRRSLFEKSQVAREDDALARAREERERWERERRLSELKREEERRRKKIDELRWEEESRRERNAYGLRREEERKRREELLGYRDRDRYSANY